EPVNTTANKTRRYSDKTRQQNRPIPPRFEPQDFHTRRVPQVSLEIWESTKSISSNVTQNIQRHVSKLIPLQKITPVPRTIAIAKTIARREMERENATHPTPSPSHSEHSRNIAISQSP
ncbi:MAG TPA: hypothetical protein VHD85_05845, partial [Terracidiphilus sp.]|nr:hypothetical protein [Terracidiphilus sp.]